MQSYAAVAASPASPASRQPDNAPSRSHKYNREPTCPSVPPVVFDYAEPVQSTPQRDFHLDTFFNPVWMSGPNVFSFAKDGTVVLPEPSRVASRSRYQPRAVRRSGRGLDKPWKNVAITEQDDAMLQAEAARKWAEAKAKLVGRVYQWPPKPQPAPCEQCAVLAMPQSTVGRDAGVGTSGMGRCVRGRSAESVMPALSWSSGGSEPESEVCRGVSSQVHQWEGPLVKHDELRMATEPFSLNGTYEGAMESRWTRSEVEREIGEERSRVLKPSIFMTEQWVEDQLTVGSKEVLTLEGVWLD